MVDVPDTSDSEPEKPKLVGRGGPGRGQGRPRGSKTRHNEEFRRRLAGPNDIYLIGAVERTQQLANLRPVPVIDKRTGKPRLVPGFNADGSPMIDKRTGKQQMVPKMEMLNAPMSIQKQALDTIIEHLVGKPVQALANDKDSPLISMKPTGKVIFAMPSGYVSDADHKNIVPAHPVPLAADNDDAEAA